MLILAACRPPPEPAAAVDLATELTARGPWNAGYRVDSVTYPDPAGDGDRTLRLATWYPTEDTDGEDARYADIVDAPGVWVDAAPAPGDFPQAVFSHGHQGYAENSGFLMAHLATHGWRVAAPDHTGNTFFDGSERTDAIYMQRAYDISAVLDALGAEEAVGIGHSFGGYTMLALAGAAYDLDACGPCAAYQDLFAAGLGDARLRAVVPMAPGNFDLFGAEGLSAAATPLFHMTATEDAPGDDIWAAVAGPGNLHLSLDGGGHQSFTDFADLLEDVPLDAEEGFRIVDAYTLAWARYHTGDTTVEGVLDGSVTISDAAVLTR